MPPWDFTTDNYPEEGRERLSESHLEYYANQTPEERAATVDNMTNARLIGQPQRKLNPQANKGYRFEQGHAPTFNAAKHGATQLAGLKMAASVKREMWAIGSEHPDLIKNALIDGLLATAPKSFPYLALFAAYLDGQPGDE